MKSATYKSAGVDIHAKTSTLAKLKSLTRSTFSEEVLSDIGLFGGLYSVKNISSQFKDPVLVSSADGVGTKLKIAFLMNKHDTVGQDIVSHCVNDILVQGARPLFFMDYIATGKLQPKVVLDIVKGLAKGCRDAGCSLIGGETAEMPGFYSAGEYDLAGFIVGVVDKNKIIDGKTIQPGDVVLGLASSGLHTNGYSLARKILFEMDKYKVTDYVESLGATVGEELLKTHRCYSKSILSILDNTKLKTSFIKGMAHLTGGGFYDNIPRILPKNVSVKIHKNSWHVLPIFQLLQKDGGISDEEMYHVFNMGIGMAVIVAKEHANDILKKLKEKKAKTFCIGEVIKGNRKVLIHK
jgi:phosphoribosylformylglycinamidine cyclo-ligase